MNDNLTTNASNEADSPAFLVGAVSGSFSRPKTRGELYHNLMKGIKCEVVASNEEFTSLALQSLSIMDKSDLKFKTTLSENAGWVIYEAV